MKQSKIRACKTIKGIRHWAGFQISEFLCMLTLNMSVLENWNYSFRQWYSAYDGVCYCWRYYYNNRTVYGGGCHYKAPPFLRQPIIIVNYICWRNFYTISQKKKNNLNTFHLYICVYTISQIHPKVFSFYHIFRDDIISCFCVISNANINVNKLQNVVKMLKLGSQWI